MRQGMDLLGVHPRVVPLLKVEDARLDPVLLANALLALAVKVPDRLRQRPRDVGVLALQRIPHGVRRHEVRLAALERLRDAQQAHEICVVGVEELARVGAVDAYAVNRRAVFPEIFDVAEDVAVGVLRDKVPEVGAQALNAVSMYGSVSEKGYGVPCMQQRSCGCPTASSESP